MIIMGMNLQNGFPSLKVRQFHGHTAVKTARPQEGLIKDFRTVGRGKDNDALAAVKTVHFRKELVQGLFPFVVAAKGAIITLFANGIDFIDKDNARSLFLSLFKEVADTSCPHTNEHLNEF